MNFAIMVKPSESVSLTGKSKPTLWRMWAKRDEFPSPQKSKSGTFLGWPEDVYDAWVKSNNPNSTR